MATIITDKPKSILDRLPDVLFTLIFQFVGELEGVGQAVCKEWNRQAWRAMNILLERLETKRGQIPRDFLPVFESIFGEDAFFDKMDFVNSFFDVADMSWRMAKWLILKHKVPVKEYGGAALPELADIRFVSRRDNSVARVALMSSWCARSNPVLRREERLRVYRFFKSIVVLSGVVLIPYRDIVTQKPEIKMFYRHQPHPSFHYFTFSERSYFLQIVMELQSDDRGSYRISNPAISNRSDMIARLRHAKARRKVQFVPDDIPFDQLPFDQPDEEKRTPSTPSRFRAFLEDDS